jgi:hypothetical protein
MRRPWDGAKPNRAFGHCRFGWRLSVWRVRMKKYIMLAVAGFIWKKLKSRYMGKGRTRRA